MDASWRTSLWGQCGAAIDMLDDALRGCPDALWHARVWDAPFAVFWNIAHHAIFWLDYYLSAPATDAAEPIAPPAPFGLEELDPSGRLPDRPYTKDELRTYLAYARQKAQATLAGLTDEQAAHRRVFPWGELRFEELVLYTMRHVQEHAAQLHLLLGQHTGASPRWVATARS